MNNWLIFDNKEIIFLFFKSFSLVFTFLYLVFCVINFQQTKIMLKVVQIKQSKIFVFLAGIQLVFSIFLFLMAFFL